MIDISVYGLNGDNDDFEIRFIFSGHADFDIKGKDIVCAAVSTLVQISFKGIVQIAGKAVSFKKKSDQLEYEVSSQGDGSNEKTMVILETLLLGIRELAESYPDNLKIKFY